MKLFVLMLAAISVATSSEARCSLDGKWRGDRARTERFNFENAKFEVEDESTIRDTIGYIQLEFRNGVVSLTMPDIDISADVHILGFRRKSTYKILHCSAEVAVVIFEKEGEVYTYNFSEPGVMWVYLADGNRRLSGIHLREFFRKD